MIKIVITLIVMICVCNAAGVANTAACVVSTGTNAWSATNWCVITDYCKADATCATLATPVYTAGASTACNVANTKGTGTTLMTFASTTGTKICATTEFCLVASPSMTANYVE
jgi:hypothetical protein